MNSSERFEKVWRGVLILCFLFLFGSGTGTVAKEKPRGPNQTEGPLICLEVSASTWRKTKQFDLEKYISEKLAKGGFQVVKTKAGSCLFKLQMTFSEMQGKPFKKDDGKVTYSTNIELSYRLVDQGGKDLWAGFVKVIPFTFRELVVFCPPWCGEKDFHREAVRLLKGELEIEYLEQFIEIKTGFSQRTDLELIASGLKHRSPVVVESAGRAAYTKGSEPALLESLFDAVLRADLETTDSWVAKAIGNYDGEKIVDRMISILEGQKNEHVRARAAWFLGCKKISRSVPGLLETVKSGPAEACIQANYALLRIDGENFLKELKAAEKKSSCAINYLDIGLNPCR